ncbi:hypothetical protein NHX12_029967 [Muraenolepis orangiensis]|uniref:Uncharacterized protein n=1 Tax=Muraenolepis orangiensis TaxID=630683 RepID=A0A9Q0EAU8_9TELE|nr:hypothetical protein NHX12_029967 [Muraenolepis orangiensis]
MTPLPPLGFNYKMKGRVHLKMTGEDVGRSAPRMERGETQEPALGYGAVDRGCRRKKHWRWRQRGEARDRGMQ